MKFGEKELAETKAAKAAAEEAKAIGEADLATRGESDRGGHQAPERPPERVHDGGDGVRRVPALARGGAHGAGDREEDSRGEGDGRDGPRVLLHPAPAADQDPRGRSREAGEGPCCQLVAAARNEGQLGRALPLGPARGGGLDDG